MINMSTKFDFNHGVNLFESYIFQFLFHEIIINKFYNIKFTFKNYNKFNINYNF